jgi:transformer-2 protein
MSNPPPEHPESNPGNNLYVSSIALEAHESDLRDHFTKFGTLKDVRIVIDPHTKESRGFGFVTFEESNDADEAVKEMNGEHILGKAIRVEKARRCKPHDSTPGSYCGPVGASTKFRGT